MRTFMIRFPKLRTSGSPKQMPKIPLPKPGKVFWLVLLVLLGLFLCFLFGSNYWKQSSKIPPGDLVKQSLAKTAEAQSYRYSMTSQLNLEDKQQTWSEINGEKANTTDLHLEGTMVNTPIEMYQIGDLTYNRDPVTDRWYTIPGYDLNRQEILITEVNPLANFSFKAIGEANYTGEEEIRDRDCWIVECTAELENQLMEVLWQNYRFKVWIDCKDHYLRKGEITAQSKNNPEGILTITAEFYDYNEPIELEVPEV